MVWHNARDGADASQNCLSTSCFVFSNASPQGTTHHPEWASYYFFSMASDFEVLNAIPPKEIFKPENTTRAAILIRASNCRLWEDSPNDGTQQMALRDRAPVCKTTFAARFNHLRRFSWLLPREHLEITLPHTLKTVARYKPNILLEVRQELGKGCT